MVKNGYVGNGPVNPTDAPGPGSGLLDNPGNPLNAITNLLNRLLDGLGLAA